MEEEFVGILNVRCDRGGCPIPNSVQFPHFSSLATLHSPYAVLMYPSILLMNSASGKLYFQQLTFAAVCQLNE